MTISIDIKFTQSKPCVVALGCFDGVHLGHASVIRTAKEKANKLGVPCCVWSFAEPPKRFYAPELVSLLTDPSSKEDLISNLGADIYISVKFDQTIADMTAEDFFNTILIKNLKACCIVCGFDFTFGKGGNGNVALLAELCKQNSVELVSVSSVTVNGESVSSSNIRQYIAKSDMTKAALLLGRSFSITSDVISGKRLGRSLGFPTINQKVLNDLCLPPKGVYFTKALFDKRSFYAITNVGTQPTVNGNEIIIETNLFDFDGDLYGKKVEVEFLEFIRPETKFPSIDALTKQVNKDIETARALSISHKKSAE